MNYDLLKQLAADLHCSVTHLVALSEDNDPFFAGRPSRERAAQWFLRIWQSFGIGAGYHLRRIHYQLVSVRTPVPKPDGRPYENDLSSWKFLVSASLGARYLRQIPSAALVDRRNPSPQIYAVATPIAGTVPIVPYVSSQTATFSYDIPDLGFGDNPIPPWLAFDQIAEGQPFLVEVWIEKTSMNDILEPLCSRLGVNLIAGAGETSEIFARQTVERAIEARRPMRILYVSDFDPGGRSMPVGLARKIEFHLRDAGLDLDITLEPIMLTAEQCEHYALPRTPIKETERRSHKFESRFGSGATELDALEALYPGEMARIVEVEIRRYIDPGLSSRCRARSWEIRQELDRLTAGVHEDFAHSLAAINARYQQIRDEAGTALDRAREEMETLEQEAEPLWDAISEALEEMIPEIEAELDDPPEAEDADPVVYPLYDSSRSYLEQIDSYRKWQGRDGGDEDANERG